MNSIRKNNNIIKETKNHLGIRRCQGACVVRHTVVSCPADRCRFRGSDRYNIDFKRESHEPFTATAGILFPPLSISPSKNRLASYHFDVVLESSWKCVSERLNMY